MDFVNSALEIVKKNLQFFLENTLHGIYGNDYYLYLERGNDASVQTNIMQDHSYDTNNKIYKDILFYLM